MVCKILVGEGVPLSARDKDGCTAAEYVLSGMAAHCYKSSETERVG